MASNSIRWHHSVHRTRAPTGGRTSCSTCSRHRASFPTAGQLRAPATTRQGDFDWAVWHGDGTWSRDDLHPFHGPTSAPKKIRSGLETARVVWFRLRRAGCRLANSSSQRRTACCAPNGSGLLTTAAFVAACRIRLHVSVCRLQAPWSGPGRNSSNGFFSMRVSARRCELLGTALQCALRGLLGLRRRPCRALECRALYSDRIVLRTTN